jgi:Icc-related predicted phosphoesterase
MRIIATSDLHYNIARSQAPTEHVAREICRRGGDVLMLVGDSAATDLAILDRVLTLFDQWSGVKLLVAGNHELWSPPGEDSMTRYETTLARACKKHGVHYLDEEPWRANGVAFVGSVGWYDYSFRPSSMKIPLRFYQHKVAPGSAEAQDDHKHLIEKTDDLTPTSRDIICRWMDGQRVTLPMSDVDFTHHLAHKLRRHLAEVSPTAKTIVAGIHHLPFAEVVPRSILPSFEFATGFMGSELLGETLLEFPAVRHVLCGHAHRAARCRKGELECRVIGSTYREKQFEVLDV